MKLRFKAILDTFLGIIAFAATSSFANGNVPDSAGATPATASPIELTFYVDDLLGNIYPDTDWTRENLLQSAIYEITRRHKAFKVKELIYNRDLPEGIISNSLSIRVIEWRRDHSGFYQFVGSADFYDVDGTKHGLGTIQGTQSSLQVFNQYDVRDSFEDVVQSAIKQAFRKIEKLSTPES